MLLGVFGSDNYFEVFGLKITLVFIFYFHATYGSYKRGLLYGKDRAKLWFLNADIFFYYKRTSLE
jgi:hypothetical protein